MKNQGNNNVLRKLVQGGWGILSNSYVQGWLPGPPAIYQGPLKRFCVPGMNCYSCPGALGACPIGGMQAVFNGRRRRFSFYVVGYLATIGLLVGRFICGWLCLFGLIQELLYMIPTPKIKVPEKVDRVLRYLKYVMLFVFVFALPLLYRSDMGMGEPFFCQYICPVGTLEGGIPLVLLDSSMRGHWAGSLSGSLPSCCSALGRQSSSIGPSASTRVRWAPSMPCSRSSVSCAFALTRTSA